MKLAYTKSDNFYFIILTGPKNQLQDCYNWCKEQFGVCNKNRWVYEELLSGGDPEVSSIKFVKVENCNWFLLRWA